MTNRFDEVYQEYEAVQQEIADVNRKLCLVRDKLNKERKELLIPCQCGHENRVGDIELISEAYGGHFNYDHDSWNYRHRQFFICGGCKDALQEPEDARHFPDGMRWSVARVFEWNSQDKPSGRLRELLEPWLDKQRKKYEKLELERKLKDARDLIKRHGGECDT